MATAPSRPPLANVFLRLADDPDLLGEYDRDPRAVLQREGLSDEQIDAVLHGSPQGLRLVVDRELEADPARRRLITTPKMIVHYGPDRPEPGEEPEEPEEQPGEDEPGEDEEEPKPGPKQPQPGA
jgi:hypothetical protein